MNNKSRAEKLFILCVIIIVSFAVICLTGCNGSCFGCSIGCENNEGGCISGLGYTSDGCGSEDSCAVTFNCVDFEEPYDDDSGDVLLLSCETSKDSCGGKNSSYNGLYCGGCNSCGNFGIFFGEINDSDIEETNLGCIDCQAECGATDGMWALLIDSLCNVLDLK